MNKRFPRLPDIYRCTGCSVCASVCGAGAISMVEDVEGFSRPQVDLGRCSSCGTCERQCPVLAQGRGCADGAEAPDRLRQEEAFAVWARSDEVRRQSSSGGVFTVLARRTLLQGGVVFGVVCDLPRGDIRFACVADDAGLSALRGSKYVQARMDGTYKAIKEHLDSGRPVLFCGTPCQIAGARAYFQGAPENLLLVELVCHGVASPEVWRRYVASFDGRVRVALFRDKARGWKTYAMSFLDRHGKELLSHVHGYPFLWGYMSNLFNRRSCANCAFRSGRSGADLALGDFWGVQKLFPDMDDDKGTSLVIIHTEKGRCAYNAVEAWLNARPADVDFAIAHNPAIVDNPIPHVRRGDFFQAMANGEDVESSVRKMLKMSQMQRILRVVQKALKIR